MAEAVEPLKEETLPEMIQVEELRERSQREDMKDFRGYLIDRGVVACLVKLYMELMEKCRGNESVGPRGKPEWDFVEDFLANFEDESNPDIEEIRHLRGENAALGEANSALEAKASDLEAQVHFEGRRRLAWRYWGYLTKLDAEKATIGGAEIWAAFLGDVEDPNTGAQPAQRALPETCAPGPPGVRSLGSAACIRRAAFARWFTVELHAGRPEVFEWCAALEPRFKEAGTTSGAPFQDDVVAAFTSAEAYPVSTDPPRTALEVLLSEPGDPEDPSSARARAQESFDASVAEALREVKAPAAFPQKLVQFMEALLERFGVDGEPFPPNEEELEALKAWELPAKPAPREEEGEEA